jgi:hypothetical protein
MEGEAMTTLKLSPLQLSVMNVFMARPLDQGATTVELSRPMNDQAVHSTIDRLRRKGFDISDAVFVRTNNGRKIFRYFLRPPAAQDPAFDAFYLKQFGKVPKGQPPFPAPTPLAIDLEDVKEGDGE